MAAHSSRFALLFAVLFLLADPAHAISDETSHYQKPADQAQIADPDEQNEFGDATQGSGFSGSGREHTLLDSGPGSSTPPDLWPERTRGKRVLWFQFGIRRLHLWTKSLT